MDNSNDETLFYNHRQNPTWRWMAKERGARLQGLQQNNQQAVQQLQQGLLGNGPQLNTVGNSGGIGGFMQNLTNQNKVLTQQMQAQGQNGLQMLQNANNNLQNQQAQQQQANSAAASQGLMQQQQADAQQRANTAQLLKLAMELYGA